MKIDYLTESKKFKTSILNFALNCDFSLGFDWYINHRNELINWLVDEKISLPYPIFAGIVSILSPANKWGNNLIDAKTLVLRYFNRPNDVNYKYCTYSSNVNKATNLLSSYVNLESSVDPYEFSLSYFGETGLKTRNFFVNLVWPNRPNFTLDRHMLTIAGLNTKSITNKQYNYFSEIYTSVWLELQREGLFNGSLSSFQAVLWCNYVFKKHGIKH